MMDKQNCMIRLPSTCMINCCLDDHDGLLNLMKLICATCVGVLYILCIGMEIGGRFLG